MAHVDEPIYDVAHLSHIELLTPRLEESQRFFTDVLSLQVVGQHGQSVYLWGYGDCQLLSRKRDSLRLNPNARRRIGHHRPIDCGPLDIDCSVVISGELMVTHKTTKRGLAFT